MNVIAAPKRSKTEVLRLVTECASVASICLGLLVILGWFLGSRQVIGIMPEWVEMKFNAACAFVLLGGSVLVLLAPPESKPPPLPWRVAGLVCALLVLLFAGLTDLEYATGRDFHIDQLVFPDHFRMAESAHPGRMSPITAFNFFCLASATLLTMQNRKSFVAQVLGCGVVFSTLVVLTGTAYGIQSLLASGHYAAVAVHTNFGLLLLTVAILCSGHEGKIMSLVTDTGTAGHVMRRLLPAALFVPLTISWLSAWAERAGFFGMDFAISLFTISTIIAFTSLVWVNSVYLQRSESENRRAGTRLGESLRRYTFLAESIPQMVWTAKPNGDVDYFNQRWTDYTGLTLEQSREWKWKAVIHVDDLGECIDRWHHAVATGQGYEIEYRLRRADGVYFWHLGRAFAMRGDDGQILQWVGTCTDIHEQKMLRTHLEERVAERSAEVASARERLQGVLDAATHVSIIASDLDGTITVFNRGAEQLLGYSAEEMIGKKTPAIFHLPDEVAARGAELAAQYGTVGEGFDVFVVKARRGEHDEREWTYLRKNGEKLTVNLIVTALRNARHEIVGFLGVATDVTARKKAEHTLRISQERLRLFVDSVQDYALIMLDPQGHVVSWNSGAERINGYAASEIIGRHFSVFYMPEDVAQGFPDRELRNASNSGRYEEVSWRLRKNGTRYLAHVVLTPIYDGDGKLLGFAKVTRDVTEAKNAEKKLRDQALILDLAKETIFIRDRDNRVIYWNEGAQRLYGWTKQQALGHVTHTLLKTQFPQPLEEIEAQLLAEGHWEGELIHRRRDGEIITVDSSWTLQRDENHQPISIIELNHDITLRKKAERELEEGKQRLDAILNSSLDGVIAYEAVRDDAGIIRDFRFTMINPSAEKMMRVSAAQLLGSSLAETFPNTFTDGLFEKYQQIVESGNVLDFEYQSSRVLPPRWYRIAGGKLGDGLVISYTEITARKMYERQLQKAKERAELADRAKGEFLANMSHEIRTPMNGVIGMTGLLLDTELTAEQRGLSETIRSSSESLLGLINDILDFSKIEDGMMSFEELDFNLRKVVEDSMEMMAGQAGPKSVELVSDIQLGMATKLRGDPGRLHQILTNLIGNAIKFTKSGEVIVRVRPEVEADNDVVVRFEIQDTGIGISPEAQSLLFQPFVQADSSTARKFGGTGLGLAICKRLAEAMNGTIGVESVAGRGSTFWVTLKFVRQLEAPLEPQPPREFIDQQVLVVDDNESSRQSVLRQITAWRMRGEGASGGEQALAMMDRAVEAGSPYQVVIIDLYMPGVDGIALARKIGAEPRFNGTRLILLTPLGRPAAAPDLKSAPVAASCVKPVRQSALFDCLMQVLGPGAVDGVGRQASAQTAPPVELRKERILLAEDNVVNQRVALGNLRKLGFEADVVANGFEVLEAMEIKRYDIILMDCHMPELDGYEVTREIRQRERNGRHVWIIAMTANVMVGDREKCLTVGMDDYVSKPLRRAELRSAIERCLAAQSAEPPPVSPENALENLADEDSADLAELIELFAASAPKSIAQMQAALEKDDAAALAFAAHTLKGSCGNLGKFPLYEICAQLEQIGRTGDLNGVSDLVISAENELRRLVDTLSSYRKPKSTT